MGIKAKSCIICLAIVLVCAALLQPARAGGDFGYLKAYIDKYPYETILEDKKVLTLLKNTLGPAYDDFDGSIQTQFPIEADVNGILAQGCKAHDCMASEAAVYITFDGEISVGVLADKHIRYWGDGDKFEDIPVLLQNWCNKFPDLAKDWLIPVK